MAKRPLQVEYPVRIIREGSAFNGDSGILKRFLPGGRVDVCFKTYGELRFNRSDCEPI